MSQMNCQNHHEITTLTPPLSKVTDDLLGESIGQLGVLMPVVYLEGRLIDGRARMRWAQHHGKKCPSIRLTSGDPKSLTIALQLARRHLSSSQRAMLAAKLSTWRPGRPSKTRPQDDVFSRDKLAQMADVSTKSIDRARRVLASGQDDLVREVEAGKLDLKRAETIVRSAESKKHFEAIPQAEGDTDYLWIGDCRQLQEKITEGSISLILTDPPWGRKYHSLYQSLFEFAPRLLKEGGHLIVHTPVQQLPEILSLAQPPLRYHWTFVSVFQHGPCVNNSFRNGTINAAYHLLTWFTKGSPVMPHSRYVLDVISAPPEKGLHPWQQPIGEAVHVLEATTREGDLVLDPFSGGGTVLLAARKLGRTPLGIEIDRRAATIIKQRWEAEAEMTNKPIPLAVQELDGSPEAA